MKFFTDCEYTFRGKFAKFIIRYLVGPLIRFIWVKKIYGLENIPKEGALVLAANHQSFFDFITIVSVFPRRIRFLAAEKFYNSKFWRPVMRCTGQIKTVRDNPELRKEAFEKAGRVLENGLPLGIFPQGTRSRNGEIERTFTGVAKLALLKNIPVIPVGIRNAFELWPPHEKIPKFKKDIELHFGKALYPKDLTEKTDDLSAENLRGATNRVMLEIAHLADKKYIPE